MPIVYRTWDHPQPAIAADSAPDGPAFAARFLGDRGIIDDREALADAKVDAASICALNSRTPKSASWQPKPEHFWTEKPVGEDEETSAIETAATKAVVITIGVNHRHALLSNMPSLIAAGKGHDVRAALRLRQRTQGRAVGGSIWNWSGCG